MLSFFEKTGKMALGSRLRMLSDRITEESMQIYALYDVGLKPKWFPVFYTLTLSSSQAVTDIAKEIGHSHPSVVRIIREMAKEGIVNEKKDRNDKRKNLIELTSQGKQLAQKITQQYEDVTDALDQIMGQTQHNLWNAMDEFEYLLDQKSLFARVLEQKKLKEANKVKIVSYLPEHQSAFRQLNEEWISTYFKMEEADYQALDHPNEYILDKGGIILVALYKEEVVGVCALIPMADPTYDFELAKMAVSPSARGKGIGWLLGQAIINRAKELGAKTLYLESNTRLEPAISLYQKLGFEKVGGRPTPYQRCNIQMELKLS
uniref:Bifunctional helix-turn-helix transcriptional regulator/GNAT family N-acetyltransferase n=1 Tax=Roseihalotalea indica TaxID=2867963 RepID=A0AA49JGX3_9BACT|nr:bifunctional helix-turn-helix transcriptional regulator/GNAT family N-acetyltransferase [Tunicatimonas sp. TK19036]